MSWLRPPRDPASALLWRARRQIASVTLLMVTALVVIVGVTTAATAIALMRELADRALDAAAADDLTLHELLEGGESYEYTGPLGVADTFVMLVDADGNVYGNTSAATLDGLPDLTALAQSQRAPDRRTGRYGDTDLRLLTTKLGSAEIDDELEDETGATTTLYLQAGHDLSLQHQLERQLLLAIGIIGMLGIAGAVVVTLFVTRRALIPIREAFDTERRFVAAASHELRTPVAIIRASAEILEREHLVEAGGAPLVEDIVGEADRMGRLVGDLMALASAQTEAIHMDIMSLDPVTYFEDISRRSAAIAEARGIALEVSASDRGSGMVINADPDRLDQLLLILVDNAIRHSPPGGTVRMVLAIVPSAALATFSVVDDGPGLRAEEIERIFEPFERGDASRRSGAGAGLGLTIARQLAQRQDARLEAENEPGHGAAFRLRMPLRGRPTARAS